MESESVEYMRGDSFPFRRHCCTIHLNLGFARHGLPAQRGGRSLVGRGRGGVAVGTAGIGRGGSVLFNGDSCSCSKGGGGGRRSGVDKTLSVATGLAVVLVRPTAVWTDVLSN